MGRTEQSDPALEVMLRSLTVFLGMIQDRAGPSERPLYREPSRSVKAMTLRGS